MSELPHEVELRDVCARISVGLAMAVTPGMAASGVKLIRNQNIRPNKFDDSSVVFIKPSFAASYASKSIRFGDVVIVRTGANIGDACVVPATFDGAQSFTTLVVRTDPNQLFPEYLAQFINSTFGRSEVERLMAGGGKGNLNSGALERFRIKLLPIQEQQAISTLLATWDSAIHKTEQLIAAKEKQKAGLMAALLSGRRRVGRFQAKWRRWHLGELFQERVENDRGDLPLLSITREEGVVPRDGLDRKDTSSEDKSKHLRICPGDIGYNTMRMWQGVSALSRHEGIVSPAYTICIPGPEIDGTFASYLFKLPEVIHLFYRYSQGLTSDTWNLKFHHFAAIRVRIPEPEEQIVIASILAALDEELALLKLQREALAQQKRGLMQKLLTGHWRLPAQEEAG